MKKIKKITTLLLTGALMLSSAVPAFAKDNATINTNEKCSLTIYKYDSEKGVGDVSHGEELTNLPENNPIKGVEFTLIKVADITQHTTINETRVLYGFDKNDEVLSVLGLDETNDYDAASDGLKLYYESNTLNEQIKNKLEDKEIETKDALEAIANDSARGNIVMDDTDEDGYTKKDGLDIGLYLVVETEVPQNVVDSTNPFFASLPMTTADGNGWNYNPIVYPKNETGNPTLEKDVRESKGSTGKTEAFTDYATGSVGDLMEYEIESKLPRITSSATYLTQYTFVDKISGLDYYKDYAMTIDFYENADRTGNKITWNKNDGKFEVNYSDNDKVMKISMTELGLSEINPKYSEYTMVITYGANIVDEAVLGETGNENTVTLTWERTSENYTETLDAKAKVYTFGLDLTKKLSDISESSELFKEVEFMLQNTTDGVYVVANAREDGVYDVTGFTSSKDEATVFIPNNEGKLFIEGIEDDTYTLTEINTAKDYVLLKDTIKVDINFDGTNATATVNDNATTMSKDGQSVNAFAVLSVVNHKDFDLPSTGDDGFIYLAIGAAAMSATAIVVLAIVKKKSKAE